MSGSNNGKYIALKFTHEEINNCILKVNNGMVLSKDQYNKLVNEIGIDNISTFNGDYNTLKNLPVIPTKLSQLENDLNLQSGNQIIEGGLSEDEVFVLIENAIVDKADKQQLEDMENNIVALLENKVDRIEGHSLVADDEIERLSKVENYDDSTLKALIAKLENRSDDEIIQSAIGEVQIELNNKVDKVDGHSLMPDDEIVRLADVHNFDDSEIKQALLGKVDNDVIEVVQNGINELNDKVAKKANKEDVVNYDDTEIRNLLLEEEPYESDIFNNHYVFACGHPVFAETINEELVITIGSNLNDLKQIIIPEELASKTIIVGGFGDKNINKGRHLAGTRIHIKNAELLAVHGGNFFGGSVGKSIVIVEDSKVKEILGGGDAGKKLEGRYADKNVVFESEVILNNVTDGLLAYAGGGGHSSILGKGKLIVNNCKIQYIMPCGAAGVADQVELHINGGSYNYVNQVNRGVVFDSKVFMNAGDVQNFYFGAETEDTTCDGILRKGQIVLNGGTINNLKFGASDGLELSSMNGVIRNTLVANGNTDDLVKLEDRPVDAKEGDFMFDVVLNKPIFFNGVNWVDSLGFIVG